MDDYQDSTLQESIAFLDVMTFEEGKAFRGGIFVTDINTYPLEFRVTSPIRPTLLQKMLYGSTLESYIYTELVAVPLLRSIKSDPLFVLVVSELFLEARAKVHMPIIYIGKKENIKTHSKYNNMLYNKIERARKERDITQEKLTKAIGRSREWYINLKRTDNLTIKDLMKISQVLKKPIEYFIEENLAIFEDINEDYLRTNKMNNQVDMLREEIKTLKEQLQKKDGQIEFLQSLINKQNEEE